MATTWTYTMSIIEKYHQNIRTGKALKKQVQHIEVNSIIYNRYISKFHGVMLRFVKGNSYFQSDINYLVRDGFWQIVKFFIKHSEPWKDNPIFILPFEFRNLVPNQWREQILLYQMKIYKKEKPTKNLIISHMITDQNLDIKIPSNILEKNIDHTFLAIEDSTSKQRRDHYINRVLELAANLKNVQLISEHFPILRLLNKESSFFDLNPMKEEYYDNYLTHLAASQGSSILNEVKIFDNFIDELKLSLNHSFLIYENNKNEINLFDKIYQEYTSNKISLEKHDLDYMLFKQEQIKFLKEHLDC